MFVLYSKPKNPLVFVYVFASIEASFVVQIEEFMLAVDKQLGTFLYLQVVDFINEHVAGEGTLKAGGQAAISAKVELSDSISAFLP